MAGERLVSRLSRVGDAMTRKRVCRVWGAAATPPRLKSGAGGAPKRRLQGGGCVCQSPQLTVSEQSRRLPSLEH